MSIENEGSPNKKEQTILETLRRGFSRPIPKEYQDLAKTAEIAPTAPSYGWSVSDILKDETLLKQLEKNDPSVDTPIQVDAGSLTEVGEFLKEHLNGDTLIDLGFGAQVFVPNLAKAFRAKRYIGVDIETTEHASRCGNFERAVFKDDMLLFVSRLPDNYGSFFVAGAEDYSGKLVQHPYSSGSGEVDYDVDILPSEYMTQLLKEIYRATRVGGLLILGANNTFPSPESVGFKYLELKGSEDTQSTFVFTKE